MDRIQRRQISARPFLRPEKFFVLHRKHSDSVRVGAGERGKCHGFDVGDIHGTATGNLFFLFHGISLFFINISTIQYLRLNGNIIGSSYVYEVNGPFELEKRRSSLGDDLLLGFIPIFVWRQFHHTHFTGFMLEEEIGRSLWGSTSKMKTFSTPTFCLTSTFGGRGNNSIESNSLRGTPSFKFLSAKLWTWPVKKNNFDCQTYKMRETLKWEKIHSLLNRLRFKIFK
jgi:hypothetical protein